MRDTPGKIPDFDFHTPTLGDTPPDTMADKAPSNPPSNPPSIAPRITASIAEKVMRKKIAIRRRVKKIPGEKLRFFDYLLVKVSHDTL